MSVNYLSVPDFHFSMSHLETSKMCGEAVAKAAKEKNVDFIVCPGDWFDSPIMATDKGGLREAQKIMNSWTEICPVAVIEGTPSHDGPGCYGIFDNVIVLKPGKVYGYSKDLNIIKDFNNGSPNAILFGIPELNKKNIHAQLNLTGEQANAEAVKQFENYIETFVAPMRLKYKDIPAIGLFHGNVTDSVSKETENDNILKRSEILISTDILEKANLDYWNLGHIHKQWQSEKINASYAGNPGFSWNEKNFLPSFEMIKLLDKPVIEKPLYGTPVRIKGTLPINFKKDVAYWVESDDDNFTFPDCVHPWSRITKPQIKKETQRITKEQADNIKTLWDYFKLIDPDVDPKYKKKVDLITEKIKPEVLNKLDVNLKYLKISGCIFFNERTVEFNLDDLSSGLTEIHGNIGEGKSGLLSFCSLYPVVIGKDTQSGRPSAIKDFFIGENSQIEKIGIVNGDEHYHKIIIKAAHTKNPKTECYLNINGIPQLEKGTFDEMFQKCEELYGSFNDYKITTFYEQPQQSIKNQSGLMTAGKTEARNIVQNIAGIDRDKEKRFALDKEADLSKQIDKLSLEIEIKKDALQNSEDIKNQFNLIGQELNNKKLELEKMVNNGNELKHELDNLKIDKIENDKNKTIKNEKLKSIENIETEKISTEFSSNSLKSKLESLSSNKQKLSNDIGLRLKLQIIKKLNSEAKEAWLVKKSDYNNECSRLKNIELNLENNITVYGNQITTSKQMIDNYNNPCEWCGKLSSDAQEQVNKHNEIINDNSTKIKEAEKELKDLRYPKEIEDLEIIDTSEIESQLIDTDQLKIDIDEAMKAESQIEIFNNNISKLTIKLNNLKLQVNAIQLSSTIDSDIYNAESNLEKTRNDYSELKLEIIKKESDQNHLIKQLADINKSKEEVIKLENDLVKSKKDNEAWKYIAKMLNPDKIPALELEIVLGGIDEGSTNNVKPFQESRYSFKTITQKVGKNSVVDKFDILIHDAETGKESSMFFKNPGHKSFFSDAYIKSLIRKRKEKSQKTYNPIILDEADGPISPKEIPSFYEMQNNHFKNETVLTVTHSSDSQQLIQNRINIEELKS